MNRRDFLGLFGKAAVVAAVPFHVQANLVGGDPKVAYQVPSIASFRRTGKTGWVSQQAFVDTIQIPFKNRDQHLRDLIDWLMGFEEDDWYIETRTNNLSLITFEGEYHSSKRGFTEDEMKSLNVMVSLAKQGVKDAIRSREEKESA